MSFKRKVDKERGLRAKFIYLLQRMLKGILSLKKLGEALLM